MGRKLLKKQMLMGSSIKDHITTNPNSVSKTDLASLNHTSPSAKGSSKNYDSACAAAGQFGLMSIFNMMFDQRDMTASQLLLTQHDFTDPKRIKNLGYCVDHLLSLGIIPIINENDAVSANQGYTPNDVFSDNDSLASLCARSFGAEVLLLLTDVQGVFDRPPSEKGAKILPFYNPNGGEDVVIGEKSLQGRGGMGAKIDAALNSVKPGSSCQACVIAAGFEMDTISSVLGAYEKGAKPKGTLFLTGGGDLFDFAVEEAREAQKEEVRAFSFWGEIRFGLGFEMFLPLSCAALPVFLQPLTLYLHVLSTPLHSPKVVPKLQ